MQLTQREKILVTQSYMKIGLVSEAFADSFYQRLFEVAPQTQNFFEHSNMHDQKRKLVQTITMAVRSLNRMETFIPSLKALGQRHVSYGISQDLYKYVEEALLWSLGQKLGDEFTPEVKEAWQKVYATITEVMLSVYATANE